MKPTLHLRVITPSSTLLDVHDVSWVQAQLADGGGIGIWPLHSPLLAESVAGKIVFADQTGEHVQNVGAGILSIRNDEITILTIDSTSKSEVLDLREAAGTRRFERLTKVLYDALGADLE